jgi:endonuclease G, mitochondrial
MAVPTHFFKVVLGELKNSDGSEKMAMGAFVMPNAAIDPIAPLKAFSVPLSALEEASGLQFFPGEGVGECLCTLLIRLFK